MKLLGTQDDQVAVRLSLEELVLLRNILHEICYGMQFSETDFQAILDASRAQAEDLLVRTNTALERCGIPSR